MPPVVGIDLGGTKILAGVVSADNQILGRAKRTTPAQEGGRAIVDAIIACTQEALETAGLEPLSNRCSRDRLPRSVGRQRPASSSSAPI